ncbi:type IV pilin biogenesis protein [Paraliobacillus sp. PM-2]|uniref:competence type IV pilus assembly protein ComGB n=1 Tax=Paraliobacillus sp. PM-2 TaxID=1462524 RepID=UPI00061BB747|nr:competence type IV pilus assembly protein ComGB [Paraliobacillus sp. PM-2]CQR46834.1 type IV pilin biogenesis protein [Paraliobacillus sp. PM-2]
MDLLIKRKQRKLTSNEQNSFLNRLTRLLEQDYPLIDALYAMQWNNQWKQPINQIIDALKEGKTIDTALEIANFDTKIISFLFFASAHGDMKKALKQSVLLLEKNSKLLVKFKQAIRYPTVLFMMFICLLYFIKTSVYPAFIQLFQSTTYISEFTLFSLQLINHFFHLFIFIICLSVIVSLSWFAIKRKCTIKTKITIYQRTPFVRTFIKLYITFLFSLHLSSLLHSGLSLKDSLKILTKQMHHQILSHYCQQLLEHFSNGQPMKTILPTLSLLHTDIDMIFQKNSNAEDIAVDLHGYADFLLEQIEHKTKKIISWIQPIFFIVMGISIIYIYFSLLYPMFQLIQTI